MMNRRRSIALLFALAALVPTARAAEFTLLVYETPEALVLRDGSGEAGAAYWQAYAQYGASLAEAGVLRGGAALAPDARAQVEGLRLGGYFIVDVDSTERAEEWAQRAPATRQGGRVLAMASLPSPAMSGPNPTPRR